ncbi:hypothetical protein ABZ532_14000 [Streptomyces sp. NPDC019396]|uniref:hypothetical protein n=1 Tax=Streptomyces sp. NPDC019396 TaxID=3154687 RepID=UPI0033D1C035
MAGQFQATVVIDRYVDEVLAFLADGANDPSAARKDVDAFARCIETAVEAS